MNRQRLGGNAGQIRVLAVLAAVVLVAQFGFAAAEAPALRVLILSGLNNHDWRSTTPVLKKLFEQCPRFSVVDVTEEPGKLDAAAFAKYDVVVSNWTPYPDTARQWPPQTEQAFLDFIQGGGGFLVIHAAACTFQVWPEFQQIIALTWKADFTGHGAYHTFKVSVEDQDHPIARGLPDLYTTDELYHNMVQTFDQKLNVVCKAFSATDQRGTGKFEPMLVWTQTGKGRGVNLVLGHDVPAMQTGFRTLLLRGAEWAATGAVTIPIPDAWPATATLAYAETLNADAVLAALAPYTLGQSRKPLYDLEQLVIAASSRTDVGADAARKALASKIAAALASNATPEAKQFLCKQISLIGSEAEIPAVAALLSDEAMSHMARYALERIPSPAADAALRDALGKASGGVRVGIVNSLGERRDALAVAALTPLLQDADAAIVAAASSALGKIATPEAAQALDAALSRTSGDLRLRVVEACLACADQWLAKGNPQAAGMFEKLYAPSEASQTRAAALRGLAAADAAKAAPLLIDALAGNDAAMQRAAIHVARGLAGQPGTAVLLKDFSARPPALQVLLLAALADREDLSALPCVQDAASSADPDVRVAALKALGALGNAGTVALLADRAAAGPDAERDAARRSLSALRGPDVNKALAELIEAADALKKIELARTLAARNAVETVGDLWPLTAHADDVVRIEGWKALHDVALPHDLVLLLELLSYSKPAERETAESAIAAIVLRAPPADNHILDVIVGLKSIKSSFSEGRCSLVRVLGTIGDDRALEALRAAAKDADANVQDAAVRALSAWPAPSVIDDLLAIAKVNANETHHLLAIQGVARLTGQLKDAPPEQTTAYLETAFQLAARADEKKALLGALGQQRCVAALRLALNALADAGVSEEAALASAQIAVAVADSNHDDAIAAVRQIRAAARSADALRRTESLYLTVMKPANLARGAKASSPDNLESDGGASGDQAAIDGNPDTYWDEVDDQALYRFCLTFDKPAQVSAVKIKGHAYQSYAPKDFDILCDDKVVKTVQNAEYDKDTVEAVIWFPKTSCTTFELKIRGYYGHSPAIRELELYDIPEIDTPPAAAKQ